MGEPVQKNEKWYTKIEDSPRGPFSLHDLLKQLLASELSIHDSISKDGQSWNALCNEKSVEDFLRGCLEGKKVVPTLETNTTPKEISSSSVIDIDKIAAGINNQLQEAEHLSKRNYEASAIRKFLSDIQIHRTRKVVVDLVDPKPKGRRDEIEFVVNRPPREPKQWGQIFKRVLKFGALVVLFGGGYWFYHYHTSQLELEKEQIVRETFKKGLEAKALGEYQKALNVFKGVTDETLLTAEELIEMAEVTKREGNSQDTVRFAKQAMKIASSDSQRAKASLILGLVLSEEGKQGEAAEHFEIALKARPDFVPALFNLGLVHMGNSRFDEAEKVFLKALQSSGPVAPIILALSEAAVMLDSQNHKIERVLPLDGMFAEYVSRFDDYGFEIALARLRIAALQKSPPKIEETLRKFLSSNADIYQRQSREPMYSHQRLDGRNLYSWCMEIFSRLPRSPQLNAMISLCLYRNNDVNEALKFAHVAAEASPKDPQIVGIYGMLLSVTGQNEKAYVVFEKTKKAGVSKGELMTRAKTCERMGNWTCAIEKWTALRELDNSEISAIEGLVNAYAHLHDYDRVRPLLREGLARYPGLQSLTKVSTEMLKLGLTP